MRIAALMCALPALVAPLAFAQTGGLSELLTPSSPSSPGLEAASSPVASPALGTNGQGDFLPPDEAFVPAVVFDASGALALRFDIAAGYYLYREKFSFDVAAPSDLRVDAADVDAGVVEDDPYFGLVEVHHDTVHARIALNRPLDQGELIELALTYQGCAKAGLCYPPQTRVLAVAAP